MGRIKVAASTGKKYEKRVPKFSEPISRVLLLSPSSLISCSSLSCNREIRGTLSTTAEDFTSSSSLSSPPSLSRLAPFFALSWFVNLNCQIA